MRTKVLFVCYGNMIRSQIAEGFARDRGDAFLDVYSAGVNATGVVSDEAILAMEEKGIDITGQHSKGLDDVPVGKMDYVVSLTDTPAADMCPPSFTGKTIDWDVADPVGRSYEYFRATRDDIEARVRDLTQQIWQSGPSAEDE